MWIIPKTLSAFVPDTEGLNLDLDERAWILESSAMWRSKPSSKPTWLRRLKKGGWITHLSTRILKPSLHESFEEKYTASLPGIHVSHFRKQGSEKAKTTQDTYGHISESTSEQLVLPGFLPKMSEVTPRWGYGESCPIWKKMVTERSGDCSVRRKQARLTNASDASSWPTPLEDDSSNVNPNAKRRTSLVKEVNQHNGPPAPEKSSTSGKNHGSWATPNAGDGKGGMNMGRNGTGRKQKSLGQDVSKSIGGFNPTMKLNPNWVEQLMGLPIGWTDLGSWEMESCRKPQN